MSFDNTIKSIRKIYGALSDKQEQDVICVFKGTEMGNVKPWTVRIDSRECKAANYSDAAENLLKALKHDLAIKIKDLENKAAKYKNELET